MNNLNSVPPNPIEVSTREGAVAYWARHHRPTFSIGFLLIVVILAVPQVRGLFPSLDEQFSSLWVKFGLFTFVVLTILSHLLAFLIVIQPDTQKVEESVSPRQPDGHLSAPQRLARIRKAATDIPVSMLKQSRCVWFLIAAALLLASLWLPDGPSVPSFLEVPIRWSALLFCLIWSAYYGLPDWEMRPFAWRMLVSFTAFAIFGEVLWYVGLRWNFTSPRIYSIGAICFLVNLVTSWVAFFDRWQALRPGWPIRLSALIGLTLGVAVMALWSGPPTVGSHDEKRLTSSDAEHMQQKVTQEWLDVVNRRLMSFSDEAENNPEQPVIIVAASGGGSRAALFAGLVCRLLDRMDVKKPPILMISSVSGGSLASAVYTDERYEQNLQGRMRLRDEQRAGVPKNFTPRPIAQMVAEELKIMVSKKVVSRNDSPRGGSEYTILSEEIQRLEQLISDCEAYSKSSNRTLPDSLWCLGDQFVDDMSADFMAPLLRGTVHPGRERGESVTHFWSSLLGNPLDSGMHTRIPWICNSTEVGSGRPFPIGSTPVPISMVSPPDDHALRIPYDIRNWKLSRWEAARLSANFPWGFMVPNIPVQLEDRHVHLIDGGVFDNTGITTIRSLIESIAVLSTQENNPNHNTAADIMAQLRRKGIILLEIDSGAKPSPPGFVSQCFSGVLEPLGALNNSAYHTSERAIRDNLNAMRQVMRDPELADLKARLGRLLQKVSPMRTTEERIQIEKELDNVDFIPIKHVKLTCNEQENVMTAWALPPLEKAKVISRFLNETVVLDRGFPRRLAESRQSLIDIQDVLAAADKYVSALERSDSLDEDAVVEGIDLLCQTAVSSELVDLGHQRLAAWELLYREKALPEQYYETESLFRDRERVVMNWGVRSRSPFAERTQSYSAIESVHESTTESPAIVVGGNASIKAQGADQTTGIAPNAPQDIPTPERPLSTNYDPFSVELKAKREKLLKSGKFKIEMQ